MNTLGLAKFSNPIGIAMALKNFYDQTQNPTLTEEEDDWIGQDEEKTSMLIESISYKRKKRLVHQRETKSLHQKA